MLAAGKVTANSGAASFAFNMGCCCSSPNTSFVVRRNRNHQDSPTQNGVGVTETKVAMKAGFGKQVFPECNCQNLVIAVGCQLLGT